MVYGIHPADAVADTYVATIETDILDSRRGVAEHTVRPFDGLARTANRGRTEAAYRVTARFVSTDAARSRQTRARNAGTLISSHRGPRG